MLDERLRVCCRSAHHLVDELPSRLLAGVVEGQQPPGRVALVHPCLQLGRTVVDERHPVGEVGFDDGLDRFGVPAQLRRGTSSKQEVVDVLRSSRELGGAAGVVHQLPHRRREPVGREVPRQDGAGGLGGEPAGLRQQ